MKCIHCIFVSSVHLKIEEKIQVIAGRDGGLQNMEVIGMVTLRVQVCHNIII